MSAAKPLNWQRPWRLCLAVAVFGFALQLAVDAGLEILRPNTAAAVMAFHPAFPDALNFQRQKTEVLAGVLREQPGQGGLAESVADPHIWLGALLMGLTVPDERPLVVFNALCHALLVALLVWHLRHRIATRWQLWGAGLLLPSTYLWASQLLRDPFLWLVFWGFLLGVKTWFGGFRIPFMLAGALAVIVSATWLYEEKRPVFMICLGAALIGFLWMTKGRWKNLGLVILLFGAGWAGEWGFWAKGLAATSCAVLQSFSPEHRYRLAEEVELRSQAWSGESLNSRPKKAAVGSNGGILYGASIARNFWDGLASCPGQILGIGNKQGWPWLLISVVDACSLSWLAGPLRQNWRESQGSAVRNFLLICGAGLLAAALLSIIHFGNTARNLSWFFLCTVFLAGCSRTGTCQDQAP